MSVEIHAALIGGLITGVVILAGVLAEHTLSRRRALRADAEAAALSLPNRTATLWTGVVRQSLSPRAAEPIAAEVNDLLSRIRVGSGGFGPRRRRSIEAAVRRVLAIHFVVNTEAVNRPFIDEPEVGTAVLLDASTYVQDLRNLVLGDSEMIDDQIETYRAHVVAIRESH